MANIFADILGEPKEQKQGATLPAGNIFADILGPPEKPQENIFADILGSAPKSSVPAPTPPAAGDVPAPGVSTLTGGQTGMERARELHETSKRPKPPISPEEARKLPGMLGESPALRRNLGFESPPIDARPSVTREREERIETFLLGAAEPVLPEEVKKSARKERPIAFAAGETASMLGQLVLTSAAFAPAAPLTYKGILARLGPRAARLLTPGVMGMSAWGTTSGTREAARQVVTGEFDADSLAKEIASGAAWGLTVGTAGGIQPAVARVFATGAGAAGVSAVREYVEKGEIDPVDAAFTFALVSGFAALRSPALTKAMRDRATFDMSQALKTQVKRKAPGLTEEQINQQVRLAMANIKQQAKVFSDRLPTQREEEKITAAILKGMDLELLKGKGVHAKDLVNPKTVRDVAKAFTPDVEQAKRLGLPGPLRKPQPIPPKVKAEIGRVVESTSPEMSPESEEGFPVPEVRDPLTIQDLRREDVGLPPAERPAAPEGAPRTTPDADYLYHGTAGKGRLSAIQREGLKPGQAIGDTDATPVHLADTEAYASTYASRKGADGYILRVKGASEALPDEKTGLEGDYVLSEGISPDRIEVKTKAGDWVPIREYDFVTDTVQAPATAPETSARTPARPAEGIVDFPVKDIVFAPEKFQFKSVTDEKGVSPLLKGVKEFKKEMADVVSLWRDPADGEVYVVDGHQRTALAERTGQETIRAQFLQADTAEEARFEGAMINLGRGSADSIDAAKVLRDSGVTVEELERAGISLRQKVIEEARAFANLNETLFGMTIRGELPKSHAIIIGENLPDPAHQRALMDYMSKRKSINAGELKEAADAIKHAGVTTETEQMLWGEETTTRSLFDERIKISSFVRSMLEQDKKALAGIAKADRARLIETKGVGKIDVEKGRELVEASKFNTEVFDITKNHSIISSILDKYARQLAEGGNESEIKRRAYEEVAANLERAFKGGEEAGVLEGRPGTEREGLVERRDLRAEQEELTPPPGPQVSEELPLPFARTAASPTKLPEKADTFKGINLSSPAFKKRTELAKKGNVQAADSIIETVLKPERIAQLKAAYPHPENIAWVPMSILLDGENVIPFEFAVWLEQNIGGKAVPAIEIKKGRLLPHRQVKEAAQRLAKEARVEFGVDPEAVPLLQGKKVILVDDQFKTGGTARDAAIALAKEGIELSGVRTLGASAWGDTEIAAGKAVEELAGKFGKEGVSAIEETTGLALSDLTKAEARAINTIAKKSKTLERFRDELRKQREAYVRRGQDFQGELEKGKDYQRESLERVSTPEPAEEKPSPPLIQAKPDAPGTVSIAGEDVNVVPKAATPEEKAHQAGLTKGEVSDLAKAAKEEDHFFQNLTDPLKEEAGQLVVPDYGKLKDIYNRGHDWGFTFGEVKRLDEPLYNRLMASYGKRNAGVEKAVDEVQKAIGSPISSEEDALLSFVYEDKRLSPPEELKDVYDKLSNILKTVEREGLRQRLFPRTFQERMEEKIKAEIEAHSEKLKTPPEKSKVIQRLKGDLEKIRNMEYLPHRIAAQRVLEKKLESLKGEEREVFLESLRRISYQYKTRKGRSFLSEYVKSGLLSPEDVGIRRLVAETLADFYQKSAVKSVFDYAEERGLIQAPTKEFREQGWMTTGEIGITSPELKNKLIHPVLASAYSEMKAMREPKKGGWRRLLGTVKVAQWIKPQIIMVYDAVQKAWHGTFSANPIREAKYWAKGYREVTGKTEEYHRMNELNLFQFPYEVSRGELNKQIDLMVRRTSKDVPGFVKGLEKITGMTWTKGDPSFIEYLLQLRQLLMAPYGALAHVTWTGDKVIRASSYYYLRDKGYSEEEAARIAARVHGAYSELSDKYKKAMSKYFFVYSFRFLMPREMVKVVTEPISRVLQEKYADDNGISVKEAIKRIPKRDWERWAKRIGMTFVIPVAIDLYMRSRGFEGENKNFGPLQWKYRKEVETDDGKQELVVGMNYILNMPVKYWTRITYYNPIDPRNRFKQMGSNLLKWEVHPLYRIGWDLAQNRRSFGGGEYIYDPNASTAKQAGQIAQYVFNQSFRFWGTIIDDFSEGRMTQKEKEAEQKIFDEALSRFDQGVLSVLGYKYTRRDREEAKRVMYSRLRYEYRRRGYELRRKYEGRELQQRIQGLEEWRKRCEKWIEQGMR